MADGEMTFTYQVELTTNTMWVGAGTTDIVPLEEFGISDQEWDEYSDSRKNDLLSDWAQENFWNLGYEFNSRVIK